MSTISSVSSNLAAYAMQNQAQNQSARTAPKPAPPSYPQDLVTLSSGELKAAGGDVDHDGDSH